MSKRYWDVCVPCECSPKSDLSSSNQILIIDSFCKCQSVSLPWPFLSQPSRLMPEVVMLAVIEIIHGLSNMDFHAPRPIRPLLLHGAQSACSRDPCWAPGSHHSLREWADYPEANRDPWILSIMERKHFFFTRILWTCIWLSYMKCFCQNYNPWTYRIIMSQNSIWHIVSDQGIHFTGQK